MTVTLELLGEEHLADVQAMLDDPDILRFTRVPHERPPEWAETWIAGYETGRADGTREAFAILERGFAGVAVVPNIRRLARTAELGYVVAPGFRGRGLATEALGELTGWAFAQELYRLELLISAENAASKRVAERCGYRYEGTMRGAYFKEGLHEDTELWARLATD